MTPKPESETDHEQAIRDYYAHCDQAERAEAAELPPVPNIIAALDTGTATPELISEWANHPYVCTTDIIRRAIAVLLAARAAEAAQHRQEIAAKDETIRQQAAQIEALKEIADEAFGVCICGCQLSEHENYGEDGEQCENEMHECIRTSKAAYAVVHTLRARLAAVEAERDKAIDENIRLTNAEIEALRAERDRLKAAMERLRDCDWTIGRGDRMDAVRDIARAALTPQGQSTDGETR